MADAEALDPWEPDPDWHPARRAAFVAYRDMAQRTFAGVARGLQPRKSSTLVRRWAKEDGWAERVEAWDAECDRRLREEFADSSADVARAQAEDAALLRDALLSPARALRRKLAEAAEAKQDPFEGMSAGELARLAATTGRAFAQVVTVERLANGQSTANLAGFDGGPMVPPSVEAKDEEALAAYLVGRADERAAREGAGA